jgi:hypothetical protein
MGAACWEPELAQVSPPRGDDLRPPPGASQLPVAARSASRAAGTARLVAGAILLLSWYTPADQTLRKRRQKRSRSGTGLNYLLPVRLPIHRFGRVGARLRP